MTTVITAAIIILGLLFLQYNHYAFLTNQKQLSEELKELKDIEVLRKEFDEYKKKVDALTLRAGFKL